MKVLVYANVGLDLIDGSTIWVQSVVEILSGLLDCEVIVLSRDALQDRGVVPALKRLGNVRIVCYEDFADMVAAHPKPGDRDGVKKIVKHLDAEYGLDWMLIRDTDAALTLVRVEALRSRVWAYVLGSPSLDINADRSQMAELVEKAGGLFVQSDTQCGLLEAIFPAACNKIRVLPPMVKLIPSAQKPSPLEQIGQAVRFVYSGKYSADWNVEAFFDIPAACAKAGVEAMVSMIGDKVHNEEADPSFRPRILEKFRSTPGVTWYGAMERDAAVSECAGNDLGLCWRTDALNDSLEISTKFLEFASVGVPSVVNRTAAYERLLGDDYPYFADTMDEVVAAARGVVSDPMQHERMRQRCRDLAADFTYAAAAERLRQALLIQKPRVNSNTTSKPKIVVASHDLKFLRHVLMRLECRNYEILHDQWQSTTTHDERWSACLLQQADIIFCEWCVGQAAWYSQRKLPHQKLYVRLHRFESLTQFPREVAADALDGVIVVSDHFRNICVEQYGWPEDKIIVLPQYCVAEQLRRDKHPGAEKTLGFVGINGFRHKRFDRAIDILRMVRSRDPDFRMRIRSAMPWEFGWAWKDNSEDRTEFEEVFRRLDSERDLRDAIIFDRAGADMAEWYRNIGFILSTSESEGCHTSVAEGICSGAMPIVIEWPGARSVYGRDSVFKNLEEMSEAILSLPAQGSAKIAELQADGAQKFDIARTVDLLDGWFSSQ